MDIQADILYRLNLEPGHGYWVKLTGAGQINIPDDLAKGNNEVVDWFKDDWGRIIIYRCNREKFTPYMQ